MSSNFPTLVPDYRVVRALPSSSLGERLLIESVVERTPRLAHVLPAPLSDRLIPGLDSLLDRRLPHLEPIESVRTDAGKTVLIAPYLGHIGGLITLDDLAASRGGRIAASEVCYAAEHLLTALDAAHARRLYNGPLDPSLVLVDRSGRTHIELYAVARFCERGPVDASKVTEQELQAELTSVFELLFRVLTGLDRRSIGVRASQVLTGLDPATDQWLAQGLHIDPAAPPFESAEHALHALRGTHARS
ncbi:MAG: hypothetical protein K2Y21_15135 [Phycisphaerales bacterium]|nr:hypothetical protein [Phycisphaerales bacterium]